MPQAYLPFSPWSRTAVLGVLIAVGPGLKGQSGNNYCVPGFNTGPGSGDFIDGVQLGTISNLGSGYGPDHADFFHGGPTKVTRLAPGQSYTLTVTSGTYPVDTYVAWIDFDGSGTFDSDEILGNLASSSAGQALSMPFQVPLVVMDQAAYNTGGYTGLRVMCVFGGNPNPDPCSTTAEYGEVEDYVVLLNSDPCVPLVGYGTTLGDYMDLVGVGGGVFFGGAGLPAYLGLGPSSAVLTAGQASAINIVSGSMGYDEHGAWLDLDSDGLFDPGSEALGTALGTGPGSNVDINFSVPAEAFGRKAMRIRCDDPLSDVMAPCEDAQYGHTVDLDLTIQNPELPCRPIASGYDVGTIGFDFINLNLEGILPSDDGTGYDLSCPAGTMGNDALVTKGTPFQLSYQCTHQDLGFGSGNNARVGIYFDKNGDLDFDDAGEMVDDYLSTTNVQTGSIAVQVPLWIADGGHYLRVMVYDPLTPPAQACTDAAFRGSVHDFLLMVQDPAGPCMPVQQYWGLFGDYISGVELGAILNIAQPSALPQPYYDYTALSTDLVRSSSYTLIVTSGTYVPDEFSAWIDYNGDGDWDDPNEFIGTQSNAGLFQDLIFNFTVPGNAVLGPQRMRVRCTDLAVGLTACSPAPYGETEDYTVNIETNVGVDGNGPLAVMLTPLAAAGVVRVMGTDPGTNLEVMDASGRVVLNVRAVNGQQDLPFAGSAAGVYVLRGAANGHGFSERFMWPGQ